MTYVDDLRAEALFCSSLQPSDRPADALVRDTVYATVFELGEDGCAAKVAAESGDHPESSAARMRWAIAASREAFAYVSA